ncbi:MAG: DUF456 domain-containing protein [Patescibacteria group bacterium]|nr:DUF456 domain-containing protein [Patescibacteria group bacterium]
MSIDIILYFVASLLIILGAIGIFLPLMPGVVLIFCGILLASFVANFSFISWITIVILGILVLISLIVDYFAGVIGAKFGGASILGILGALFGSLFGFTILGPIGLIVGPALGVLVFELISKRSPKNSLRVAGVSLISTLIGLVINIIIALTMIIIFIFAIFV